MHNNKLIKRIIEQFFTDDFILNLLRYIANIEYNESNRTKLKLIADILTEINKQLIETENERVKKLLQELKQSVNDGTFFSDNINTIYDSIMQLEQYKKFLKQIQRKIEQVVYLIQLRLNYTEKNVYNEVLEEYEEKLRSVFGIESVSEITEVFTPEILEKTETKIKQLNIKWTELKTILDTIARYETLVTKITIGQESNESITELVKEIQDYAYRTTIELTKIYASEVLDSEQKNKNKKLFDKLSVIQITNDYITDEVSEFINQKYSSFDTGLTIFDNRLNGIESGAVYLIAAPTNHGKTLLLIKTLYSIIASNEDQFNKGDAILFITLEDSNIKVLNRIYSVFGNYQYKHLTQLQKNLKILAEYIKQRYPEKVQEFREFVRNVYSFIKNNSIDKVTHGNVEIFVQDAREKKNEYSVVDIITTIEQLKTLGYNIRAVFIDYIELMSSTKKYEKEYSEQGQIVIELRNLANTYMVPIIAATQLNRAAEDSSTELTNQVMGDSYNKAKFSDYVIMIRQIKTDIGITPNEITNDEKRTRGRKKKQHPELSQIINAFMPISETQTRIKEYIQTHYPKQDFPNFKKLLQKDSRVSDSRDNESIQQILNQPTLNMFKKQEQNNEHNTTFKTEDNPDSIDEIYTDAKIITDLFRLVEYNIPKAKDGINIPSCGEIVTTINEKLKIQYPEILDKIKYSINYVFDKNLIYPNSRYMLQYPCQLNNNYVLFSKFNLRIYSIPEIPIAVYDYLVSLENFNKLNNFLYSNEIYQKILIDHGF